MSNQEYLQAFLDESDENLRRLNDICLRFDAGERSDEDFAAFFRAAHTLKGMSATMGYTVMANITHQLEDALGYLREHPNELSEDVVDALFSSIDALETMVTSIRDLGHEGDGKWDSVTARLQAVMSASATTAPKAASNAVETQQPGPGVASLCTGLETVIQESRAQGIAVGIVRVFIDPTSVMKGPRAVLVMRALEAHAEALRAFPDADLMESGTYDAELTFVVALVGGDESALVKALRNVSEVTDVEFSVVEDASQVSTSSDQSEVAAAAEPLVAESVQASKSPSATKTQDKIDRTIRVPVEKLDVLMNLLSELVIDRTRLSSVGRSIGNTVLMDTLEHMSRISNDLQTAVMSLRLVPVENLFQRFPRMVRDLGKSLGKSIQLEMQGLETEFDRTIIDEMGEALVHLIRNAADHGLESEAQRIQSGKPREGHMVLSAYSAGQDVYIEVRDDGRGIHTEQVLKRALQNGLVSAETARTMKDEAIYALLFESGFSTAETLSDISGRGVGLDAVKRKVESLGGSIEIFSTRGAGTTFRIRLPLTLAIQQALLVDIHSSVFALPLSSVVEVVKANEADVERVHGLRCLRVGTAVVPIFDPGQWFYNAPQLEGPWQLVVCADGSRRIAIAVNRLLGQEEIVHKSLGAYLGKIAWFSGAALLGDGRIALIADLRHWMD